MEHVRRQELALAAEKRDLGVDREAEQKELAALRARCKKLQGRQVALETALRSKTQLLETVVVRAWFSWLLFVRCKCHS